MNIENEASSVRLPKPTLVEHGAEEATLRGSPRPILTPTLANDLERWIEPAPTAPEPSRLDRALVVEIVRFVQAAHGPLPAGVEWTHQPEEIADKIIAAARHHARLDGELPQDELTPAEKATLGVAADGGAS